jgi:hypothetical protein
MSSTLTNLTAATTWSGTDLFYATISGNSRKIAASSFLVAESQDILSLVRAGGAKVFRMYSAFTDSSNYERFSINSAAGIFEFAAESAGTGSDNIHFGFRALGTGVVYFQGGAEIRLQPDFAPPAGGSANAHIRLGNTTGFGLYYGSGVPTVSAAQGSLYLRSDGSSISTRLYVNTNGSTTWTNVTTAA